MSEPHKAGDGSRSPEPRMPVSLLVAIGAMVVVTVFVVVALFLGDVAARGARITVTIVYFAVFVGTTIGALAVGTRRRSFPVPLALGAAVYVMAYGSVLVWVDAHATAAGNAGYAVGVLVPLWLLVIVPVLVAWAGAALSQGDRALEGVATAGAVILGLEAILTMLPLLLDRSFGLAVGALYWRIVTAAWVVAAMLVAVFALLLWWDRSRRRPTAASLPWPVAEDGVTPLPVSGNGRPAFEVLVPFDGRRGPVREGDPEAWAAVERARVQR